MIRNSCVLSGEFHEEATMLLVGCVRLMRQCSVRGCRLTRAKYDVLPRPVRRILSVASGTQAMFIVGIRVFRPHAVRRSECRVLAFSLGRAALASTGWLPA
jgi:hypothetical protein